MGDIGLDQWFWKMREHKRKGHQIMKYAVFDKRMNSGVSSSDKRVVVLEQSKLVDASGELKEKVVKK